MSNASHQSGDPSEHRRSQARAAIRVAMEERRSGQSIDKATLLRRHPELMPELDEELKKMSRIAAARKAAARMATVGEYRIQRQIGQGGMGSVAMARDPAFGRDVALKQMQPQMAQNQELRQRFIEEARITGWLEHPGVIPIYAMGVDGDGKPFYTMRFVDGQTFTAAIGAYHEQPSRASLRELLRRFIAVCQTMSFAHDRGVIHRDLKPSNVMLGAFGETLVLDWGLARRFGAGHQADDPAGMPPTQRTEADARHASVATSPLGTLEGQVVGTPSYMSPEQAAGQTAIMGPPADIYSLGAMLFHLLTGQAPYQGSSSDEVIAKVLSEPPEPSLARGVKVPAALTAITLKAMARDPAARYASAGDLALDVQRWLDDEPVAVYRDPWTVRVIRWARAHRTAATASTVGLLAVMLSGAAGVVAVERERAQTVIALRLAEEQSQLASQKEAEANALAEEAVSRRREAATVQAEASKLRREASSMRSRLADLEAELASSEADAERRREEIAALRAALIQADLAIAAAEAESASLRMHASHLEKEVELLRQEAAELRAYALRLQQTGRSNAASRWGSSAAATRSTSSTSDADTATSLGPETLVSRPIPIPDVDAWTLETVGHRDPIGAIAVHPDGRVMATASGGYGDASDLAIRLWDTQTLELRGILYGCEDQVLDMKWSPSGDLLVAVCANGQVVAWRPDQGRVAWRRHLHTIAYGTAFSPDGKRLAVAGGVGRRGLLTIHETDGGGVATRIVTGSTTIFSMDWDRNQNVIAVGQRDGVVQIWDPDTHRLLRKMTERPTPVSALAFSPDGLRLAATQAEINHTTIWDPSTGTSVRSMQNESRRQAIWGGDGNSLYFASWNFVVVDADTGHVRVINTTAPLRGLFDALAITPDRSTIFLGHGTGRIIRYVPSTNAVTGEIEGLRGESLNRLKTSADKLKAAALTRDRLYIWDDTRKQIIHHESVNRPSGWLHWHANNRMLCYGSYHSVRVYNVERNSTIANVNVGGSGVWSAAWAPAEPDRVAAMDWDGGVHLITLGQPNSHLQVRGAHSPKTPSRLTWSMDGRFLASIAGSDFLVRIWNGQDLSPVATIDGHASGISQGVSDAAFSPEGDHIATAGSDRTIRIWSVEDGVLANVLDVPSPAIHLTWTAEDGLTALHLDQVQRQWSTITGDMVSEQRRQFVRQQQPIESFSWSSHTPAIGDGSRLLFPQGVVPRDSGFFESRYLPVGDGKLIVASTGHYRADGAIDSKLRYVTLIDGRQQTWMPDAFTAEFGWVNDSVQVDADYEALYFPELGNP